MSVSLEFLWTRFSVVVVGLGCAGALRYSTLGWYLLVGWFSARLLGVLLGASGAVPKAIRVLGGLVVLLGCVRRLRRLLGACVWMFAVFVLCVLAWVEGASGFVS